MHRPLLPGLLGLLTILVLPFASCSSTSSAERAEKLAAVAGQYAGLEVSVTSEPLGDEISELERSQINRDLSSIEGLVVLRLQSSPGFEAVGTEVPADMNALRLEVTMTGVRGVSQNQGDGSFGGVTGRAGVALRLVLRDRADGSIIASGRVDAPGGGGPLATATSSQAIEESVSSIVAFLSPLLR